MIYHYKDQILARFKWFSNPSTPFVLFILVILNYNFSKKMGFIEVGFYINLILNLLMVISLLPQTQLNIISPKVDKLIGKWSYPIYLCHFQAGILTKVLFPALKIGTLQMAVYSLPALMLITLIINYVIEAPIEKIRRWIKMRNTSAPHPAGIAKAPAA